MKKIQLMIATVILLSAVTSCSGSMESDADQMAALACKATTLMMSGNIEDDKVAKEFEEIIKEGEKLKTEFEKKYTGEEWTKFQSLVETKAKECQK